MKIKYPSTINEPILFFKWFFTIRIIQKFEDWFFDDKENTYSEPRINPSQKANRENQTMEYIEPFGGKLVNVKFSDGLDKYLTLQVIESMRLIDENVINMVKDSKDYKSLLKFYLDELMKIEENSLVLFDKYPNLLKPVINIQNYINERYLDGIKREYTLVKNENLVQKVLGYLNGKNEAGVKIMSTADYGYLKEKVNDYIKSGIVPSFNRQVPKLKGIDNLTLRYTFYTLWKQLSDPDKYPRDSMIQFLKMGFEQLCNTSEETLYNNLTKKPDNWKGFIPKIVKEQS